MSLSDNRTTAERVALAMEARAAAGEPEPGTYICHRCGRGDGVRMYARVVQVDARTTDVVGELFCPCCSHPGCPHREGPRPSTAAATRIASDHPPTRRDLEALLAVVEHSTVEAAAHALGIGRDGLKARLSVLYERIGAENRPHAAWLLWPALGDRYRVQHSNKGCSNETRPRHGGER